MPNFRKWPPFFNQRLLFMLAFGFSSGLPFALSSSTLQAWLTEANVGLLAIGFFSLVSLPYNCKFLWAPLLDRFIFPRLGRRRGWILLTQLCLSASLFWLSQLQPQSHVSIMGWLALLLVFFSATQDVALDAYRADTLLPPERGFGAAYFVFAYRVSMFVSGGLALVVASFIGWERAYQLMAVLMLLNAAVTLVAPENVAHSTVSAKQPGSAGFFIEPFRDLWRRNNILLVIAFIVFYKAGASLSVALMTNFLLHGLGFSLIDIGVAAKIVILVSTILGGFVGGAILWRLGVYPSLLWFGLAQAFSILSFMLLAIVGKSFSLMMFSLFIEDFCSGMSNAAFIAFLMSLCNTRYSATQYAFFSAIDTLPRLLVGPVAAILVLHWGWVSFYAGAFALSLPAIVMLMYLRKRVFFNAEALSYS